MLRAILLRVLLTISGAAALPFASDLYSQDLPYENIRDRFSFAQMYLSLDLLHYRVDAPHGTPEAPLSESSYSSSLGLTIGALHFWGFADFYVSFPVAEANSADSASYSFGPGIETGAKIYPFALRNGALRPYGGIAFAFPSWEQGTGPYSQKVVYPLLLGLAYIDWPVMVEAGIRQTANSDFDYYLSPEDKRAVDVDDTSFSLSVKWLFDVSTQGRRADQSDLLKGIHAYVGIGPTSSWLVSDASYIQRSAPWLETKYDPIVFPELSAGLHGKFIDLKGWRTILNLSYRPQRLEKSAFGEKHIYKNDSIDIALMQSFLDYYGFVPFVGISYSINSLEFRREDEGHKETFREQAALLGAIFGWDIIPVHKSSWFLRTTLRYFPEIAIEVEDRDEVAGKALFPNFEFNFIQFIYQL